MTRQCAACSRALPPSSVYFRFALAIEAEQDVLDEVVTVEHLASALEDSDPQTLEEQVHLERSGILCGPCRNALLQAVGASAEPH